jgi:hypothetical protein
MENDYYTPAIEDLHVGYECELERGSIDKEWCPYVLELDNSHSSEGDKVWLYSDSLRTLYLTKEQIESEGWKSVGQIGWYEKGRYSLLFGWITNNRGTHSYLTVVDKTTCIYAGSCPSINEFRTIMKLLGIK